MFRSLATLVGLAALAVAGPLRAQDDDFSAVEIRTEQVAPGVHMLVGRGGNLGVSSGPDGIFLIDDQFAPLHDKIRAAVAAIQSGPIRFVVNTHWHGDHTGGNEALGGGGAVIVAHDAVRARMSTEQFIQAFGRRVPPSPPAALPVVTFSQDVTFHLNGDEIHVFHVPSAHTDGDSIVHFRKADVIHAGDVVFSGRYPFIDLSSGGSMKGVIAAVERILGMAGEGTAIIPGHGPRASRADLVAYRDMLVFVRDLVAGAIASGTSVDDLVASEPLAAYDAQWGGGFVKSSGFLKLAYASLGSGR